jgi:hypothetical protein
MDETPRYTLVAFLAALSLAPGLATHAASVSGPGKVINLADALATMAKPPAVCGVAATPRKSDCRDFGMLEAMPILIRSHKLALPDL